MPPREVPWLIRTYSGHSSAAASNALYRQNLAKGQTGLSVAFDLPTQTGYDSDHPLAMGEVGKVGVPIGHIGDMETLFADIPLGRMNTSMTINATAPWLLALYIAAAERQGAKRADLTGTTQNDIIKEYLSRGTYIFPPEPSLKLTTDTIALIAAVPDMVAAIWQAARASRSLPSAMARGSATRSRRIACSARAVEIGWRSRE